MILITVYTQGRYWSLMNPSTPSHPFPFRNMLILFSQVIPSLLVFRLKFCIHFSSPLRRWKRLCTANSKGRGRKGFVAYFKETYCSGIQVEGLRKTTNEISDTPDWILGSHQMRCTCSLAFLGNCVFLDLFNESRRRRGLGDAHGKIGTRQSCRTLDRDSNPSIPDTKDFRSPRSEFSIEKAGGSLFLCMLLHDRGGWLWI
jgi:hypothetical protein